MLNQMMDFFNEVIEVLQGFWQWCSETTWQLGSLTFTPLSVFSSGLFVFLGILVFFLVKNLIL